MMTAFEHWQNERDALHSVISAQQDINGVVYEIRHAILQTEQNTLAAQSDDVLRQQTGVLFSMLKNSVSLLSAPISSTTWVAASKRKEKRHSGALPLMIAAFFAMVSAGLWGYARGDLLGWMLPLAALVLACIAMVIDAGERKKKTQQNSENVRVTFTPDPDKLLAVIDGQMRSLDRCINDFSYLNDTLRNPGGSVGKQNLNAVSELLEVIYSYDEDLRSQADDAVTHLLSGYGLVALEYTRERSKLFNALPSKNMTRTICPAIVSAEDHRLLRRGTAVVQTDAA
ncbi:MAG: hypothetical protein E7319_09520 [Clostridiales bacterium]|nr:hypothetical protein [Clostridiales bacterium]